MEITKEKKKPGLPARLTPMQRKFAEILVFAEGHKFAYECAKEAGYDGDNATLRKKASELQNPKYYPLVFKHIGELREEILRKHEVTYDNHVAQLGKIREEALKKGAFSAATNAEKNRGMAAGLYIDRKIIKTGKLEDLSEEELELKMKKILDDYAPILNAKQVEALPEETTEVSLSSSRKPKESSSDLQKSKTHPRPDHKNQTT